MAVKGRDLVRGRGEKKTERKRRVLSFWRFFLEEKKGSFVVMNDTKIYYVMHGREEKRSWRNGQSALKLASLFMCSLSHSTTASFSFSFYYERKYNNTCIKHLQSFLLSSSLQLLKSGQYRMDYIRTCLHILLFLYDETITERYISVNFICVRDHIAWAFFHNNNNNVYLAIGLPKNTRNPWYRLSGLVIMQVYVRLP